MNPNYRDFEQPIAELEVKIEELQLVGSDNNLNIGAEIGILRTPVICVVIGEGSSGGALGIGVGEELLENRYQRLLSCGN